MRYLGSLSHQPQLICTFAQTAELILGMCCNRRIAFAAYLGNQGNQVNVNSDACTFPPEAQRRFYINNLGSLGWLA